jgi:hypothetical protein
LEEISVNWNRLELNTWKLEIISTKSVSSPCSTWFLKHLTFHFKLKEKSSLFPFYILNLISKESTDGESLRKNSFFLHRRRF